MKFLLLILGLMFLYCGFKMFKSRVDIINTSKELGTKGGSTLFDKIVNDDFEDDE